MSTDETQQEPKQKAPEEKIPTVHCSFCGSPDDKVERMITSPNANICAGCVERSRDIIGMGRVQMHEQAMAEAAAAAAEAKVEEVAAGA